MTDNNKIHEELWSFPCEQGLKITGYSKYDLADVVSKLLENLKIKHDKTGIRIKKSSKGKYVSITVTVTFENKIQVEETFANLSACEAVIWAI